MPRPALAILAFFASATGTTGRRYLNAHATSLTQLPFVSRLCDAGRSFVNAASHEWAAICA